MSRPMISPPTVGFLNEEAFANFDGRFQCNEMNNRNKWKEMNEILFLWRKITREVELEKVHGKEQSLEDKFNLLNARCALNT